MPVLKNFYSFQILGIFFGLTLIVSVYFLVRSRRIQEKYSLVWFVIGFFVVIFSIFLDSMEWFSALFGIEYAPSAFFAILIVNAYVLLLNKSISISTLKKQNKSLIQELGLMGLRVEQLEKVLKEENRTNS